MVKSFWLRLYMIAPERLDGYLYVFILMKKFLFSINLYVFIPMILFYC